MADALADDRLKMKDEDGMMSPFQGIEKGSVLQDCRCFNDLQLDTKKCEAVLVRLLYLVGQGEKLSSAEATDVFFSVTKLFQANAVRFATVATHVSGHSLYLEWVEVVLTTCVLRFIPACLKDVCCLSFRAFSNGSQAFCY